ncbi:MAG: hypothetical protein JXA18_06855 [Chitinispirillaceae bacterium]|nr:hypothetical protein [Chitinispirillaceae bacterium]
MKKHAGAVSVVLIASLLLACSSVRRVVPLESGASAITVSLGGPVTEVGKKYLPLPLLSAGYNYGINGRLGIEAGLNLTGALFGLLHVDAGVNWYPLTVKGPIPGITVTPKLFFMTNFESGGNRLYPTITPTLYWKLGRHLVYTGIENWFEVHTRRSDGNEQPRHWLIAPYLGWGLSWKKWLFQLEGRGYTPNLANTGRATKNIGFGSHGVIGFFMGVSRTIGGAR